VEFTSPASSDAGFGDTEDIFSPPPPPPMMPAPAVANRSLLNIFSLYFY
jgi:hypothetical protein